MKDEENESIEVHYHDDWQDREDQEKEEYERVMGECKDEWEDCKRNWRQATSTPLLKFSVLIKILTLLVLVGGCTTLCTKAFAITESQQARRAEIQFNTYITQMASAGHTIYPGRTERGFGTDDQFRCTCQARYYWSIRYKGKVAPPSSICNCVKLHYRRRCR